MEVQATALVSPLTLRVRGKTLRDSLTRLVRTLHISFTCQSLSHYLVDTGKELSSLGTNLYQH